MTDLSSEYESQEDSLSPLRRVNKLFYSSGKIKPRRKKKMPPELNIIRAPTGENNKSDNDKSSKFGRPRSVSLVNEIITKTNMKPASWHQFRHLPPPKCLTDVKKPKTHQTELQVKLNSLKKNIWTGIPDDEKGPLSWGISSFAMNTYFTDSEALLRSCSKKLEELEEGKMCKEGRKKKKTKSKKVSEKISNKETTSDTLKVPKITKKRGKLKSMKTESISNSANTNFTDVPKSNQYQSQDRKTKAFKKGALVATAIQTKKKETRDIDSDNSDTDAYLESTRKYKKKTKKSTKVTLVKTQSLKSKN